MGVHVRYVEKWTRDSALAQASANGQKIIILLSVGKCEVETNDINYRN
jgi:hypothetical protein